MALAHHPIRFTAALCAAGFLAAMAQAAKVDLSPKFRTGDETTYSFLSETKQHSAILNGREQRSNASSEARLAVKVADVGADGARLEIKYERLRVLVESPQNNAEFDSEWTPDRAADLPLAVAVRALVGKPLICTVNAAGELVAVDVGAVTMPEGAPGAMLRQMLDREALGDMVGAMFSLKPAPAQAAPGETWTRTRSMKSGGGGSLKMTQTIELVEADAERARTTLNGKISMEGLTGEGAKFMNMKRGDVAGATVWDLTSGLARTVDYQTNMVVEDSNPQMKGSIVTVTVSGRQRLELLKHAPAPATKP